VAAPVDSADLTTASAFIGEDMLSIFDRCWESMFAGGTRLGNVKVGNHQFRADYRNQETHFVDLYAPPVGHRELQPRLVWD
jgi:hypothetical protein